MTGSDIKSEFFEALKEDENTDYDTAILRQINRALDIIAGEPVATLAEQEISITASGRVYALPSGVTRVRDVYISGYPQGLRRMNPHDAYAAAQTGTTGTPLYYWEENENILFHPMPNASYTAYVLCEGAIPHLSALTDTLNLRAAVVGPPAVAATALAPAYCIAIPEFVKWRLLSLEKADYQRAADEAKENWGALVEKAWNLDRVRFAKRFSGPIRSRGGDLPDSAGYWIR